MKKRKRARSRRKDQSHLRTYSFVATIIIIMITIVGLYYQSLPKVEHIPASFTFNFQDWMTYVPSDAEYVSYVNYEQAYYVTNNSSLFGSDVLFELPQLGFKIVPNDITYELLIQLPEPQYSGSATVLQLTTERQTELADDIASLNPARMPTPVIYRGHTVYEFLMRKFGDQYANLGYLTLLNQELILSNDKSKALQNVKAIVDQASSQGNSLFDDANVRRGTYAAGVENQSYVGLYVGMFSTQLNDTKMVIKSVIGNGDSISVSRALLFPTSDTAMERLNQAHEVYKNAGSYRILDSWLVVTYDYPLGRMPSELIGI